MTDWQKASDRLKIASEKYREAMDAEQEAFREWIDAGRALDDLERAGIQTAPAESP